MKKDLGYTVSFIICLYICNVMSAFADDIILPDFKYYFYNKVVFLSERADRVQFEAIRNKQSFSEYFDKVIIAIKKSVPEKNLSASEAGKAYLARVLLGSYKSETYIITDRENLFEAVFCSENLARCEYLRVFPGYDGQIETRYVHNNIWHFQNNIGSFIEANRRLINYPNESLLRSVTGDNTFIRL